MSRLLCLFLSIIPAITFAGNCKVINVSDGDTFICFTDENEQRKVRLAEIDAPEINQPYGDRSRLALYNLISSEMVKLNIQDKDSYGRTVARVKRGDGIDVNAEQLRAGAAWIYPKHLKDTSLLAIEAEAKDRQIGIWALPASDQIPPWEWRHSGLADSAPDTQPARKTTFSQTESSSGSFNCSTLKWCGQMSCAEAQYQLSVCGNPNLDGDRDGRPCERQCR